MKAGTVGIDLAKNVFQLHVSDKRGGKIFNKKVSRKDLVSTIDKLDKEEDFLVAMEACGGSHHVARTLGAKGYQTRIISAKFVKPYVKSNKNDAKDAENGLTMDFRATLKDCYDELDRYFEKVEQYDNRLQVLHNNNEDCKRLSKINGVGLATSTALVAAVGNPHVFKNGREFAAWLGLTPRQCSTGGKTTLLGTSKRGDKYIRKNLIHRCRPVVNHSKTKDDNQSRWINKKLPVKGFNKTAVAVANKTARVIWVVLARKEEYKKTL